VTGSRKTLVQLPFAAPAPESCKTRGRRCGHRSGEKPGGFPEAISHPGRRAPPARAPCT
jgi:hypothetical protein